MNKLNKIKNSKIGKNVVLRDFINIYDSEIGDGTKIGCFCDIGGTVIGKNCRIQSGVSLSPGTVIGNNVFLGPGARSGNEKYPCRGKFIPNGVTLKDNVIIGMGALLLPGVIVYEGALVGAGAVITKNVACYCTVIGNPGKRR